jgi:hypothetical protein
MRVMLNITSVPLTDIAVEGMIDPQALDALASAPIGFHNKGDAHA